MRNYIQQEICIADINMNNIAIFDLDGTLVETDAANAAAYNDALHRIGYDAIGGLYGRVSSSVVREAASLSDAELEAVVKAKVDAYCRHLWRVKLGPAANSFRCVLLNRNAFDKVVLLTDSKERRAYETLNYFRMDGFFDEIVCNGGRGDKYVNYFRNFDSNPAACVVWENEEGQIKSAIAAGVKIENIRKVA